MRHKLISRRNEKKSARHNLRRADFYRSCLTTSCPKFELTNSGAACLNDMTLGVHVSVWINNWSWRSHWSGCWSRYWRSATAAASACWCRVATRITANKCITPAIALENFSEQTTPANFQATTAIAGWGAARIASTDFSAACWSTAWSCAASGTTRSDFNAACWSRTTRIARFSAAAWCTS